MKDWIKKLSGEDIRDAYDNVVLEKVSDSVDKAILQRIQSDALTSKTQDGFFKKYRFQLAFSGAAALIAIMIPFILFFLAPRESSTLQISKIENAVLFEYNHNKINLSEGSFVEKGTVIKTASATCSLSYGKESSIFCSFNSEIAYLGKTNQQIEVGLIKGKIIISEKIKLFKSQLRIKTPFADIKAVGTKYRVEYLNNSLLVYVEEGKVIIYRKDRNELIEVNKLEEVIININDSKRIFYEKRNWKIQHIGKLDEKIEAFVADDERVYGITQNHRIAFSYNGTILWKTGNEYPLLSTPHVYADHLFIPVDHRIIDVDPKTGKLKLDLRTAESLFGYHAPVVKNNMLYLAYSSGLWTYDLIKQKDGKILSIMGSTPPVFYSDILYSSSYLTKTLEAFNTKDEQIWSIPIYGESYHRPILADNSLIVTVWGGTVKKYDLTGKWLTQTKVKSNISSIVQCEDSIFFLDESNHLSIVEPQSLDILRIIPDVGAFTAEDQQKFVTVNGDQINIYRNENPDTITAPAAISSVLGIFYGNRYFLGLEDGTILIMEAK